MSLGLSTSRPSLRTKARRLGEVEEGSKDSVLNTALVPLHYPTGNGGEPAVEFAINPELFHDAFAADLPEEQTALMAATQRPVAESGLQRGERTARLEETPVLGRGRHRR